MVLNEKFLAPISEDKPSGDSLRYPLHDQIRQARLEDADRSGTWTRETKINDSREVIRIASDALANKTKDLQVAAWLTEAWTWQAGLDGLHSGLTLIHQLLEKFWDTLYPEPEDGDLELRSAPLDWLGNYLDPAKRSSPALALQYVPLNAAGHGNFKYQEAQNVGYKKDATSSDQQKKRAQAVEEGKLTPEDFDDSFEATPKPFYRGLEASVANCLIAVNGLQELCDQKFGRTAPSFSTLRKSLEQVQRVVRTLLTRKLEKDPDPPEPVAPSEVVSEDATQAVETAPAPAFTAEVIEADVHGLTPANVSEATLRIVAAAHYLRRKRPGDPSSYLVLRGLRWGELRASGSELNLAVLTAPPTEVRTRIRSLAMQAKWAELLDAAEVAMGTECGRGWLDLQRYAIRACKELGHGAVVAAITSALVSLLSDYPNLHEVTLTDDTGTANPDTLAWLKETIPAKA